jgi:hypothetical protein
VKDVAVEVVGAVIIKVILDQGEGGVVLVCTDFDAGMLDTRRSSDVKREAW